jgi:hypothetical protein
MTDAEIYSFTFDTRVASQVFQQIGTRDLVLAVLAGIVPPAEWDGCTVYEGPTPEDPSITACVGLRGRAADQVQQALVEAFESFDIPVPGVYEGGPEQRQPIATASSGQWVSPD